MKLFAKKKTSSSSSTTTKISRWSLVSSWTIVAVVVIVLFLGGSGFVIKQSNTNPQFCGGCHVMQSNVQSYLTSNHLDNLHAQADVQCKDCHDYSLLQETISGVKYLVGAYSVNTLGSLPKQKFDDAMCTRCHISNEYVADQTDFLSANPHLSHYGELACSTCHLSHDNQIDFCSNCHYNGGQRVLEAEIVPRAVNPWASDNSHPLGAPTGN